MDTCHTPNSLSLAGALAQDLCYPIMLTGYDLVHDAVPEARQSACSPYEKAHQPNVQSTGSVLLSLPEDQVT